MSWLDDFLRVTRNALIPGGQPSWEAAQRGLKPGGDSPAWWKNLGDSLGVGANSGFSGASAPPPPPRAPMEDRQADKWAAMNDMPGMDKWVDARAEGPSQVQLERMLQNEKANQPAPRLEIPNHDPAALYDKFLQEALRMLGPDPAAPDEATYVKPFDEMLARLVGTVNTNRGAIQAQLPQMQQQMQRITDQGAGQFRQAQQNLAQSNTQQQQMMQQARQQNQQFGGGGPASQAAAAAIQATQAAQQQSANDYSSRIQTQANMAGQNRQALANAMIQAGQATLSANEAKGRNQIDMGRAQAQRQFQQDYGKWQQAVNAKALQARQYAQGKTDRLSDIYGRDKSAVDEYNATMQEAYAPVKNPLDDYSQNGDGASRAVRDIVEGIDSGRTTLTQALNALGSEEGQAQMREVYGDVDTRVLADEVTRLYQESKRATNERNQRTKLRATRAPILSYANALRALGR